MLITNDKTKEKKMTVAISTKFAPEYIVLSIIMTFPKKKWD